MNFNDTTVPPALVTFMDSVVDAFINPLLGLIFGAAFVYFLWGMMVFIMNQGNESKAQEGKQHMLWGVVGMVVMVSAFALIWLALATFGIGANDLPDGLPFGQG
jgi:succinate dehydrogenase/fumarate reductase cytochrome b subunit